MDAQAYNVILKIHECIAEKSGDKLDSDKIAYITGLLEALLDIYSEPREEEPEESKGFKIKLP